MNEMNFDSLKHIQTPQAWLDKASAISAITEKKRSAFPLNRYLTAASIVLVSAVVLLIVLHFGSGKAPVTVHEGGIVATDSRTGEAVVGETTGGAPQTDASAPAETIAVLSTDADGNTVITYEEKPDAADGTQPANGRTSPTSVVPTAPHATEAPGQPVPSTERPPAETEASAPTSVPAADPPTQAPTQPYKPPATQEPTEGYKPPGDCEIYGMFRLNTVSGSGYNVAEEISVFCRLYDSSGSLVGDSPLYSPQREATIISRYDNGTVLAFYNPAEEGLYLTEDAYEYVFYDVHGNELYRDVKFVF